MINLCIDWKRVEIDFMGEKITAEVRPPSPAHMLVISPHLNFDKQSLKDDVLAARKIYEMQKDAGPILPELVRNIEGLTVNGAPVDPAMLGSEATFGPLVTMLITKIFSMSVLDKESEKNLPSPPAVRSPGRIAAE